MDCYRPPRWHPSSDFKKPWTRYLGQLPVKRMVSSRKLSSNGSKSSVDSYDRSMQLSKTPSRQSATARSKIFSRFPELSSRKSFLSNKKWHQVTLDDATSKQRLLHQKAVSIIQSLGMNISWFTPTWSGTTHIVFSKQQVSSSKGYLFVKIII